MALERFARAQQSFEAYLRLDDRSPAVLYKLALARFRQGNAAGAVDALGRAIAITDRLAEPFYVLGLCQSQLGQPADAVASLERALRLSPAFLPAREELVRLLLALDRDSDAIWHLEALAALETGRPDHLIQAGLIYSRLGRTDLAVAELNRAAERDPQPRVYQALGRVWLEAAENRRDRVALSKAIEALDRGVRGPGATSEGLTLYGRALLLRGDTAGAEQAFEEALEKTPIDPVAYRELGGIAQRRGDLQLARDSLALQMGQLEEAASWLRQASDAGGDDPETAARLARAQLRAGDRPGAAVTVERGLKKAPANAALLALQRGM
jgi:tetratricopeptide (TPR) repeat protein